MDPIIRAAAVDGTHVLRRPQDRVTPVAAAAPAPAVALEKGTAQPSAPQSAKPSVPLAMPAPVAPALPAADPDAAAASALAKRRAAEQELLCASQAAQIERLLAERQQADTKAGAAQQQSDAALAQAKAQLAALEKEQGAAFDGAQRRGFAEGEERGAAAAAELVREQVERFVRISGTLAQSKLAVLADAEDMLVEIAFTALCRMLGEHAATRAGVAAQVQRLIHGERDLDLVTVHLHPDDLAALEAGAPAIDTRVRLQGDAALTLGGCVLEGPRGTLDARLDLQLQRLREALMTVRAARGEAGDAV
jgi:flagellar assembly protein FliH